MKHILLSAFFSLCVVVAVQAQQRSAKFDLSVFPNPTTEFISVQDDSEVVGQVIVFNLVGKKMKVFNFSKGEHFYIADLPKGMYMVQLLDRSEKVLSTQKLNKR